MGAITITDSFPLADWQRMDEFLQQAYFPSYVLRDRNLFHWMFRHPARDDEASVICAREGDSVVSILGYMVTELFWGNTRDIVTGCWIANWSALPAFRAGSWTLLRRLQKLFPVQLGQNASPDNLAIVPRLGYTVHEHIPRYLSVLSLQWAEQFKRLSGIEVQTSAWERLLWNPAAAGASSEVRVLGFPSSQSVYRPDWDLYPHLSFGTIRSPAYLDRRYLNHPYFRYRVLACGSERAPALCVYRVEQTSGSLATKVGRIVEFLHPCCEQGKQQGRVVLTEALRQMAEEGCGFVDLYLSSDELGASAKEAGMVLEDDKLLPCRLNPVEFQRRDAEQNVELYAREGRRPLLSEMYVTKSDGDQDRPNAPFRP